MTTATSALTRHSDRWRDQVILRGTAANLDNANLLDFTLPAGFGDCLLLEAYVYVDAIDVLGAAGDNEGVRVTLYDSAGATDRDIVDCPRWTLIDDTANALAIMAHAIPDEIIFWRENERLRLYTGEIDTDATPTADLIVWVRVQQLRGPTSIEDAQFVLTS